jgi:hypothetical protein
MSVGDVLYCLEPLAQFEARDISMEALLVLRPKESRGLAGYGTPKYEIIGRGTWADKFPRFGNNRLDIVLVLTQLLIYLDS